MRRFDKKKNIKKANLLAEQRHLTSKGLIKEDEFNLNLNDLGKGDRLIIDLMEKHGMDESLYQTVSSLMQTKDTSIKRQMFNELNVDYLKANKIISRFYNLDGGWNNQYDTENQVESSETESVLKEFYMLMLMLYKHRKVVFSNIFILKWLFTNTDSEINSNSLMNIVDDKSILTNLAFGKEYSDTKHVGSSYLPHELIKYLSKENLSIIINDIKTQGEENTYYQTMKQLNFI